MNLFNDLRTRIFADSDPRLSAQIRVLYFSVRGFSGIGRGGGSVLICGSVGL